MKFKVLTLITLLGLSSLAQANCNRVIHESAKLGEEDNLTYTLPASTLAVALSVTAGTSAKYMAVAGGAAAAIGAGAMTSTSLSKLLETSEFEDQASIILYDASAIVSGVKSRISPQLAAFIKTVKDSSFIDANREATIDNDIIKSLDYLNQSQKACYTISGNFFRPVPKRLVELVKEDLSL